MNLKKLEEIREKTLKSMQERGVGAKILIKIDMGSSGIAAGSLEVYQTILTEIRKRSLKNVMVIQTGELGFDSMEPIVKVEIKGTPEVYYGKVNTGVAANIVTEHIINGKVLDEYVISLKEEEV